MELLASIWFVAFLGLPVAASLIGLAVIRKWTMLIAQIVQRPEYSSWKPLLGYQLLLLFPGIFAFIVLTAKQQYPTSKFEGIIFAIADISFHPLWIFVSATGFWIMRNFHDASPANLRRERLSIMIGLTAYILVSGWFILLPITSINDLRIRFLFLTPLSSLLGLTFLRTSAQPDPDKRRPLKWIARDVAICYIVVLVILAFPPLFRD